ncbi:MAG: hypothetical protein AB7O04_09205, partial [Hyphomonadaceae bacterium]
PMEFFMRARTFAIAGLALAASSTLAFADPVAHPAITFAPELHAELQENYGEREARVLSGYVDRALQRELTRAGIQNRGIQIETTIIDARPNRPTFQQLIDRPGLDSMGSVSIGGAELSAVLRGADGQALGEVRHRYYESDIRNVMSGSTWHDAQRAIGVFARKVAREYQRIAQ